MPVSATLYPRYDVSLDGSRFVILEHVGNETFIVRVVENWYEEFRDRQQE